MNQLREWRNRQSQSNVFFDDDYLARPRSTRENPGWLGLLLLAVPVLPVFGQAGAHSKVAGTEARTVSHLDGERHFLLHLPNGKKPANPLPLVVALHGAFTDGKMTEGLTKLSELADEKDFAVVYPDANPAGGPGIWEFWMPPVETPGRGTAGKRRLSHGRDDIGFIAAMIDLLLEEAVADPRRIYLTGISNGAFMANRLSIDLGDRIAAIAPVAGTGLKIGALFAKPKRAMPVVYFHGIEDKIIGVDGTDFVSGKSHSQSAEEFTAWWVERNACVSEPVTESLPDLDKNDGCTVERLTWAAGESNEAPVLFYRIVGGGHSWPGGSETQPKEILGNICRDIEASKVMWDFFSNYALPEKR